MLALDMWAPAYKIDEVNIADVGAEGALEARRRAPESARKASEVVGECRWSMSVSPNTLTGPGYQP